MLPKWHIPPKIDRQPILTKHHQASTSQVQHRCQAKVEMDATDGAEPFPKQNIYRHSFGQNVLVVESILNTF